MSFIKRKFKYLIQLKLDIIDRKFSNGLKSRKRTRNLSNPMVGWVLLVSLFKIQLMMRALGVKRDTVALSKLYILFKVLAKNDKPKLPTPWVKILYIIRYGEVRLYRKMMNYQSKALQKLLVLNPDERIDADTSLKHSYFTDDAQPLICQSHS